MPDWDDIFSEKGRYFTEPHPDIERIANIFSDKKVKKILDIGFGTGRHIIFFSKRNFEMYGLDASPKGFSLTEDWLAEEGLTAELVLHRMEEKFPFQDNFFDAIISIQVIHHNKLQDILKTVGEIERVLKKNGMIFITFPILERRDRLGDWQLKKIEERTFIPQKGPEKGLPHHFFSLDEIHNIFNSFDLLEIYSDRKRHRAILGVKK
jgi:ubiquinone/menaquinone biosynthesis C-methylase UbiE